ncbi:putative ATP-grasp-modified RiPP [Streptomyces sp. NPDC012403]|uniref:putative ATP-grasp-modified RiPP n=1 Tax=Streptomyces sp. NPDC012403 TaxID=3364831 RepID=UPI0036F11FA0
MKPFPTAAVLAAATVVLDADRQVGRWVGPDGLGVPEPDRHKWPCSATGSGTRACTPSSMTRR